MTNEKQVGSDQVLVDQKEAGKNTENSNAAV
jgi:hypothetical protein